MPSNDADEDERLLLVPITWVKFDPSPPQPIKSYSFILVNSVFKVSNDLPIMTVDGGQTAEDMIPIF